MARETSLRRLISPLVEKHGGGFVEYRNGGTKGLPDCFLYTDRGLVWVELKKTSPEAEKTVTEFPLLKDFPDIRDTQIKTFGRMLRAGAVVFIVAWKQENVLYINDGVYDDSGNYYNDYPDKHAYVRNGLNLYHLDAEKGKQARFQMPPFSIPYPDDHDDVRAQILGCLEAYS